MENVRRYTNFDDMKADEYRYWQSRPAQERIDAVEEMIQTAYRLKGWELKPDVPRLQRSVVRLPCPCAKYLIVGGYAVIFHAQPRFTKDMDVFIQADPANAHAVFAALTHFGASLHGISPDDFTDPNSFFRFGRDPRSVDILPNIPGVNFEEAWKRRVEAVIDEATGLTVNFIAAEDLVAAKLAAGRPQDLADADAIQKARQLWSSKTTPSEESKHRDIRFPSQRHIPPDRK